MPALVLLMLHATLGAHPSRAHVSSTTQLLIPSYILLTTTPQQQSIRMVSDMIIPLNNLLNFFDSF